MALRKIEVAGTQKGCYAYLKPMNVSVVNIRRWFLNAPFEVYRSTDLHMTTMYSYDMIPMDVMLQNAHIGKMTGLLKRMGWLGNDGNIVLFLDCPDARKCFDKWCTLGLKSTHEGYTPHISITKDLDPDNGPANRYIDYFNKLLRGTRRVPQIHFKDEGVDMVVK